MRFTRWDQTVSSSDTDALLQDIALWHCEQADCEKGCEIAEGILLHDYAYLVHCSLDPVHFSPVQLLHLRQALAFYGKRQDLDIGVDRRDVARVKFLQAEKLCRETNELFQKWNRGEYQFRPFTERVFYHAVRTIRSILGEVPKLHELKFLFGPGATTQVTRRTASWRAKLSQVPACSVELRTTVKAVLHEMPLYSAAHALTGGAASAHAAKSGWVQGCMVNGSIVPVEIHPGTIVYVPKSAKEDRTVMIEPSINTMCQSGIGHYMAVQLRRAGLDIRDQTPNQRMAREGSLTGALATLDLSSASDTVAKELVYHLLPLDWASFLSRFRTGSCSLDGNVIELAKFSSMGNGFTFPLETLIFYALAKGAAECLGLDSSHVRAYGDDIIVPTSAYEALSGVLHDAGFLVNKEKSYSTGSFRESCGKDYASGIDVRPVYQKDRLSCHDVFRLHNHYVRMHMTEASTYLRQLVDTSIQIEGPDGYGDGHLISDQWHRKKSRKILRNGFGGSTFDTFTYKSVRSFKRYAGDHVLPSYSVYVGSNYPLLDPTEWAPDTEIRVPSQGSLGYDKGELFCTLPGVKGCKRISIYTFN